MPKFWVPISLYNWKTCKHADDLVLTPISTISLCPEWFSKKNQEPATKLQLSYYLQVFPLLLQSFPSTWEVASSMHQHMIYCFYIYTTCQHNTVPRRPLPVGCMLHRRRQGIVIWFNIHLFLSKRHGFRPTFQPLCLYWFFTVFHCFHVIFRWEKFFQNILLSNLLFLWFCWSFLQWGFFRRLGVIITVNDNGFELISIPASFLNARPICTPFQKRCS